MERVYMGLEEEIERIAKSIEEKRTQIKILQREAKRIRNDLKSLTLKEFEEEIDKIKGETIGKIEYFTKLSIPYKLEFVDAGEIDSYVLQSQLQRIPDDGKDYVKRLYENLKENRQDEIKSLLKENFVNFCLYFSDVVETTNSLETLYLSLQDRIILSNYLEYYVLKLFDQQRKKEGMSKALGSANLFYNGGCKSILAESYVHLLMQKPLAVEYEYLKQNHELKRKILKENFIRGAYWTLKDPEMMENFFVNSSLLPPRAKVYEHFVKAGVMKYEKLDALAASENEVRKKISPEDYDELEKIWEAKTVCRALRAGSVEFVVFRSLSADINYLTYSKRKAVEDPILLVGRKFISSLYPKFASFKQVHDAISRTPPSLNELLEPEAYLRRL
ncbi:MAG: hypothetical protein QMD14_00560 [Candidatus Aenigmarchaeota archaeon]|nr:hypothetical protein [Candidatus Aenigmarchaeota archaeon]